MAKHTEYSQKTQDILRKCDSFLYKNSKHLQKTKRFLKNLEDDLLIAEAERIVRNYKK